MLSAHKLPETEFKCIVCPKKQAELALNIIRNRVKSYGELLIFFILVNQSLNFFFEKDKFQNYFIEGFGKQAIERSFSINQLGSVLTFYLNRVGYDYTFNKIIKIFQRYFHLNEKK